MSVSFSINAPREHISRHTGRPTGRIHRHKHHRPAVVVHEHISRHTGRPTGRPHIHRHRFHYYAKTNPTTISGSALAITLGALSLITGVALIALGAISFNPILLGVGGGLTGLGFLSMASGAAYLGIHHSKHKKEQAKTPEPQTEEIN